MSQRLREKECMIALERELNISIIDYYSDFNSIIILINTRDRIKWYKNKPTVKKISKQIGKYLNYVSLPCSVREAARQCVFPVEIVDVVLERNNGKTTLFYLIDQCIKDFVMNKHGSKFKLFEILLKKHFNVDNIRVEGINPEYYDYYGKKMLSKILG